MGELISVNKFAGIAGVDEALIRRHIAAGRFSDRAVVVDEKGRRKINSDVALSEFTAMGIGSEKSRRLQPKPKAPDPDVQASPDPGGKAPRTPGAPDPDDVAKFARLMGGGDEDGIDNVNKSKARFEYYRAETAEVEYKKLIGDLVPKAEVYRQLFDAGADLRKGLLTIPDQTIDNIMAAKTRSEAHALLFAAIERELVRFTDGDVLDKKEDAAE